MWIVVEVCLKTLSDKEKENNILRLLEIKNMNNDKNVDAKCWSRRDCVVSGGGPTMSGESCGRQIKSN